jgi:enediyne polyketide synthase
VWLEAQERRRDDRSYVYDLSIFAGEGSLVERWSGLVLERVTSHSHRAVWPPALLAPRLEELAMESLPSLGLRAACVPGVARDATERALSLALGCDTTLRHRADGRPEVDGAFASASHAAGHTLAVAASQPVACDLEVVAERSGPMWRDLLGCEGLAAAEHLATTRAEPFDLAATRVWCARECIRKLGASRETPLLVACDAPESPGVVRLSAGRHVALTFAATLDDATPVVATLFGKPDA